MSEFIDVWKNNVEYLQMLELMGRLSNIFSNSKIPFLHYRVSENLFCKYFNADNLSRSDIAYDAKYNNNTGIGIKTFQINSDKSLEKIAEFNKLSNELNSLHDLDLARKISQFRNERIDLADRLCNLNNNIYHIIGRKEGELVLFNTAYNRIDINNIQDIKTKKNTSLSFNDGKDEYVYNFSKSVLLKQFYIPNDKLSIPIDIISDPYSLLKELISSHEDTAHTNSNNTIFEYVILPLYSERGGIHIPLKSGLNQWNGGGRNRDINEVYVPIPSVIQDSYPNFFPNKKIPFELTLPNGETLQAKICQGEKGKALMSNPNSKLGQWLLRNVIKAEEGEIITIEMLNKLGFNSLMVIKTDNLKYKITVSNNISYNEFSKNINL